MSEIAEAKMAGFMVSPNGIPVIGPVFNDQDQARAAIQTYIRLIKQHGTAAGLGDKVSFDFERQQDGCCNCQVSIKPFFHEVLTGLDDLMVHRFQKGFREHRMFILTAFVGRETERECLVLSENLGVIIYQG